jgi:hypothetical protein
MSSVTGPIYELLDYDGGASPVKVTLFTKQGCTLCDKVKDVRKAASSFFLYYLWTKYCTGGIIRTPSLSHPPPPPSTVH